MSIRNAFEASTLSASLTHIHVVRRLNQAIKIMSTFELQTESKKTVSNRDINDIFDDIALCEDRLSEESYQKGLAEGKSVGNTDGYHLGYHRGAELGAELGYYYGVLQAHSKTEQNTERQQKFIESVSKLITDFPRTNDEQADILGSADAIRAQYRKTCAILKISGKYPESDQLSF